MKIKVKNQKSKVKFLHSINHPFIPSYEKKSRLAIYLGNSILLLISLVFATLFSACQNQNRINEDKFVKIYTDMVIAQDSIIDKKTPDSLQVVNPRTNARNEILKRYNVSLDQYQSTVDYYNQYPERWQTFFDKVIANVDSMKTKPPR